LAFGVINDWTTFLTGKLSMVYTAWLAKKAHWFLRILFAIQLSRPKFSAKRFNTVATIYTCC